MGQATPKPTTGQEESTALCNLQAERALLACCIVDPAAALASVRATLNPEDLYSAAHQSILDAILAIHNRGQGVDLITVTAELAARKLTKAAGGATYVQSLVDERPVVVHAAHYVQLIAEQAYRRRLEAASRATIEACHNGVDPADAARKVAEVRRPNDTVETMCRAIMWHKELEEAKLPEVQPILGRGLLARGDYGILYGPKGSGKSWLALDLAARVSEGQEFLGWQTAVSPVLVWSLELTRERLRERLRAISPGVIHKRLALFGKDSLSSLPGSDGISPIPRLALADDQARVLTVVRSIGPGLVVIDPLGPAVAADENAELPAIARFLLELAARAGCAVLATHHPRKGDPKNPSDSIHELRGASQLGDWASCAFHLKPNRGLYCLTHGAEPRHCPQPPDVWLARTKLGTFAVTDAPEREASRRDMRTGELRQAFADHGRLTLQQAADVLGISKQSAHTYIRALGATKIGHGPSTVWTLESSGSLLPDDLPDDTAEENTTE